MQGDLLLHQDLRGDLLQLEANDGHQREHIHLFGDASLRSSSLHFARATPHQFRYQSDRSWP